MEIVVLSIFGTLICTGIIVYIWWATKQASKRYVQTELMYQGIIKLGDNLIDLGKIMIDLKSDVNKIPVEGIGSLLKMIVEQEDQYWTKLSDFYAKLDELVKRQAITAEQYAALPKLVEGLIAVTKEQVGELVVLQDVTKRYGLRNRGGDSFMPYDEEAASQEGEIQDLERAGLSREDAEERVKSASLYKRMRITR